MLVIPHTHICMYVHKHAHRKTNNRGPRTRQSPYFLSARIPPPGKDHAAEVAAMAIDLLHGTENFVIPHMPGERLQIRIGIHTGPAVAGVIGTKMPRYCLFGDSVNLAAKIEATGLREYFLLLNFCLSINLCFLDFSLHSDQNVNAFLSTLMGFK